MRQPKRKRKNKMPLRELELKFIPPSPGIFDEILQREAFGDFQVTKKETSEHLDAYYDKSNILYRRKAMLRVRTYPGQGKSAVMTLKSDGTKKSGVFSRSEYEVEVPDDEGSRIVDGSSVMEPFKIATDLAGEDSFPKVLEGKNLRSILMLENPQYGSLELALDRVKFIQSGIAIPDYEIELEDKGAGEQWAVKLGMLLEQEYGLNPSEFSKYERGVKLFAGKEVLSMEQGIEAMAARTIALLKESAGPVTVHISGGSGSGKGYITQKALEKIEQETGESAKAIPMDDYYKGDKGRVNFDEPEAVDLEEFARDESMLKLGLPVIKPVYSFAKSSRVGTETFTPSKLLIVDGIFALSDNIAANADLKVFVDIGTHGRLLRRLLRDAGPKGRTGQHFRDVFRYFMEFVVPMHDAYIETAKKNADIIITNEYDPNSESLRSGNFEVQAKFSGDVDVEDLLAMGAIPLGSSNQIDTYYTPKDRNLASTGEIMRVRDEGTGDFWLSYKGPLQEGELRIKPTLPVLLEKQDVDLLAREYDISRTITKRRRLFYAQGLVVSLDNVKGLGKFIEISSTNSNDVERIKSFSQSIGLKDEDTIIKSYFELVTG